MSPQPEDSCVPGHYCSPTEAAEFSPDEHALLLQLAHDSIFASLENRSIPLDSPSPHLAESRGVFTTLYLNNALRGCVGYVFPISSVYRAVAETAVAAAFQDGRFPAVSAEEAPYLKISLSILSPLKPVRPEEIEIGLHGLLVSQSGQRGLLLPQVPIEHRWDRITFLEQTCRKAGLPPDAWLNGALVEAFTAEVFGEKSLE